MLRYEERGRQKISIGQTAGKKGTVLNINLKWKEQYEYEKKEWKEFAV